MRIKKVVLVILITLLSGCTDNHHAYQAYIEAEYIYLTCPYSGILTKLAIHRGEQVTQHQLLFTLDQQPQLAEYNAAVSNLAQAEKMLADMLKAQRQPVIAAIEAQVAQAQADIELASQRVERNKKLYERGVLDKDSYQQSTTNLQRFTQLKAQYSADLANAKLASREDLIKSQQAAVDAANAKVDQAKWDLNQKTVVANSAGEIYDTYFREGEFVPANQPVASLLTPDNIRATFFIPETALATIKLGQSVAINCDNCDKSYPAKISYISPQAEYAPPVIYSRDNNYKLMYRIYAYPQNPQLFHPGQPVYVHE